MQTPEKLTDTAAAMSAFSLPDYDALPDIGLYMDQVTAYLNRLLIRSCPAPDGEVLTGNRINNYVKGGYIARPEKKKYNKEQISALYMLCCLKQTLSIPAAAALLRETGAFGEELYARFKEMQEEAVRAVGFEVGQTDADTLAEKAVALSLRAAAERFAAEAILESLCGTMPKKREKEE